ncbi:MAG: hypothetical protein H0W34_05925 [Pyrinomonadaceae bacterium]|nr:hypothetical protein [Pyrinomonadaceae bacterium]
MFNEKATGKVHPCVKLDQGPLVELKASEQYHTQRVPTKSIMAWDAKRQLIWLAGSLTLGTLIAYQDAHDDDGTFVPRFFIFMESLVLIIIGVLFYFYSRRKE